MFGLRFDRDDRHTEPNVSGYRRARFEKGWADALSTDTYRPETLKVLTWQNLGYRLGCLFGSTEPTLIATLYEWCVEQQSKRNDA